MTSNRKFKKTAQTLGLTAPELALAELVDEVLDELRWLRILAYGNQYLLNRHVKVEPEERDRIFEAATRAVDKDAKLHEWRGRLARIRGGALQIQRSMNRARKDLEQGRPAPARLPPSDAAEANRDEP